MENGSEEEINIVISGHVASGDGDKDEGCWETAVLLGFGPSAVGEVKAVLVL